MITLEQFILPPKLSYLIQRVPKNQGAKVRISPRISGSLPGTSFLAKPRLRNLVSVA